jgi:hypothetical protein
MMAALDDTLESDEVRTALQKLRRDFQLETDMTAPVKEYTKFREGLELVKYAGRLATQEPTLEEQLHQAANGQTGEKLSGKVATAPERDPKSSN